MPFHAMLVWLEENVRKPLEGTKFDVYIAKPLKDVYCKIKKQDYLNLSLKKNVDILNYISNHNSMRPELVIGFAAETNDVENYAEKKLNDKNCDWIIANDVGENSSVMGGEYNTATFITKTNVEEWQEMYKVKVAEKLAKRIIEKLK